MKIDEDQQVVDLSNHNPSEMRQQVQQARQHYTTNEWR